MRDVTGKVLRMSAIILISLTGAMNLLGGIGTVCAAFLTENFPSMMAIWDYRWLYQSLMIVTILIGLAGIWIAIRLAKGGDNAYRIAVILLGVGTLFGAIHYYASMTLRGSAAPANIKLYVNVFTLFFFLLLKLPGIRERVDFEHSGADTLGRTAGGLAAIIVGLVIITTSQWVGSTHVYEGVNWTDVLGEFLFGSGLASIFFGGGILVAAALQGKTIRQLSQLLA
jgi:hypothetical protein